MTLFLFIRHTSLTGANALFPPQQNLTSNSNMVVYGLDGFISNADRKRKGSLLLATKPSPTVKLPPFQSLPKRLPRTVHLPKHCWIKTNATSLSARMSQYSQEPLHLLQGPGPKAVRRQGLQNMYQILLPIKQFIGY